LIEAEKEILVEETTTIRHKILYAFQRGAQKYAPFSDSRYLIPGWNATSPEGAS
jgi:hypothetical protein